MNTKNILKKIAEKKTVPVLFGTSLTVLSLLVALYTFELTTANTLPVASVYADTDVTAIANAAQSQSQSTNVVVVTDDTQSTPQDVFVGVSTSQSQSQSATAEATATGSSGDVTATANVSQSQSQSTSVVVTNGTGTTTIPVVGTCAIADVSISGNGFTATAQSDAQVTYNVDFCDGTSDVVSVAMSTAQSSIISLGGAISSVTAANATACAIVNWNSNCPATTTPQATITSNPSTIYLGETSTVTWTSQNVSSVDIPGIGNNLPPNGSQVVTPSVTTTYTGTYHALNGTTLIRSTTVTVLTDPNTPDGTITAIPSIINLGSTSTVTWTSVNVSSVNIPGIGNNLPPNGSQVVTPSVTTTYTGTYFGTNGTTFTRSATVTVVTDPNTPACSLTANPTSVSRGGSATLTWSSVNATTGSINQSIGSVPLSGSRTVSVDSTTQYTATFANASGVQTTCSATVSVSGGGGGGGGGGRCLNCDDDDDDDNDDDDDARPGITLAKTVTRVGDFISLDQVPYTGFEAGPGLTLFFWFVVLLMSVVIAYVVTKVQPINRLKHAFTTYNSMFDAQYGVPEVQKTGTVDEYAAVQSAAFQVSSNGNGSQFRQGNVSVIEEIAHSKNILLSPEALRLIQQEVKGSTESEKKYLDELFETAKTKYPHEEGWILLSKERIEVVFSALRESKAVTPTVPNPTQNIVDSRYRAVENIPTVSEIEQPFRVEPKTISRRDESVRDAYVETRREPRNEVRTFARENQNGNSISSFVESLTAVDKKSTFDILRTASTKGVDHATFITSVVRALDEVYRNRIEGGRKPNQELAKVTGAWSNADFENVLGILVECIDYSYTNDTVGTKVALAKAFEHFEKSK